MNLQKCSCSRRNSCIVDLSFLVFFRYYSFRSSSHKFSLIVDSITFFEGSSVIKNVIAPTFLGFWDRF
ncbi:hypothetical protein AR546_06630 [Leptospira interrogans serovar Canicola]|nr:hypothetical protein B2G47_02125 [Leptospira interrogans serovar Canicola]ASV09216.1 hypothetical protein B2G50_11420 [Leptospira interrogans serovar Canicola]OLZ32250.1 hypothetical protein AR546_06630 [Leptospira interrogans serovar Canicola]POR17687.1 hypothetical protein B0T34_14095 [Leptospira interrogans serovar Canicola]